MTRELPAPQHAPRQTPLRGMLTRSFALVAMLAVSVALVAVVATGMLLQRNYARENLHLLAQQASYAAEIPIVFNDVTALRAALAPILATENVARITVRDNSNRIIMDSVEAGEQQAASIAPAILLPAPVDAPVMSAGSTIGSVRLVGSAVGLNRLIIATIIGTLLCIAAIIIGTIAIARHLNRTLVVPLSQMADVAHAVRTQAAFDHRVPGGQITEINDLAGDFNALLDQLQQWQTQVATTHEALLHRASYDTLSGLPNRATFVERVRDAIRSAQRNDDRVGILFMDGDNFKSTNDRFGHAAGDTVITEVAARIVPLLRVGDVAARMGGDEFAILVHHIDGIDDATSVAQRVEKAMQKPISVNERDSVTVGMSVGIALFPDDGTDVDQLIQTADDRMYAAKKSRVRAPAESQETDQAHPMR